MAELRQRQVATAGAGDAGAGRGAGAEARGAGGEEDADGLPALHPDTSILFPALALAVLAGASVRGFWKLLHSPGASVGDDLSSHFSEIATFVAALRSASWDLWFDRVQGGYPLLMTYTPLPLLAFGPVLALAGGDVERELFLFRCGLLALYLAGPLCWYRGARGLGFDRLLAVLFSAVLRVPASNHRACMHARTHARTRMPTRTCTCTHACTHTCAHLLSDCKQHAAPSCSSGRPTSTRLA